MQANSINRLSINWNDFQNKVFASVRHAQSIADTYPAIQLARPMYAYEMLQEAERRRARCSRLAAGSQ